MLPTEIEIFEALDKVKKPFASWDKRFIENLVATAKTSPLYELTEKQKEWMYRLLYKYRKKLSKLYSQHKAHPHCTKLIKHIKLSQ